MANGFALGGFGHGMTQGFGTMMQFQQLKQQQENQQQEMEIKRMTLDIARKKMTAEEREAGIKQYQDVLKPLIETVDKAPDIEGTNAFIDRMKGLGLLDKIDAMAALYGQPGNAEQTLRARVALKLTPEQKGMMELREAASGGAAAKLLGTPPTEFQRNIQFLAGQGITATPEELKQGVLRPPPTTTLEIPGEHGTTTFRTGGAAGAAGVPITEPGQGGKPLPREAQDNITGALGTLYALNQMKASKGAAGLITGIGSEVEAKLGTDPEAVKFNTARQNLLVTAQALIKGIPSNFDIKTFEKTLPALTDAKSVVDAKLDYTEKMTVQLLMDTIGYYKYTGFRIPPSVIEQSKAYGVDVNSVPAFSGTGSATAKTEQVAKTYNLPGRAEKVADGPGGQTIYMIDGKWVGADGEPLKRTQSGGTR